MTARRWMIAVALAGVVLGTAVEIRRLAHLRKAYESRARHFWKANLPYDYFPDPDAVPTPRQVRHHEYQRIMREYHGGLRRKYKRAAARPWLPVEPDPPPPAAPAVLAELPE